MRKTVRYVGATVAAIGLAVAPAAKASPAAPGVTYATGTFVSAIPCVPTSAPQGNAVTCTGSSTWLGTLSGQSVYTVVSDYDLLTGAGSATIHETFIGRSSDGRTGTIHFHESVTSNPTGLPDTGTLEIVAIADFGTGGFAGASGGLEFFGTVSAASSEGGYTGKIRLSHG